MKTYKLIKEIPGLRPGAVFIHDAQDSVNGNHAHGCIKLAWENGMCQQNWCGGTFIFPGQLAQSSDWFAPIENPAPPPPRARYHA